MSLDTKERIALLHAWYSRNVMPMRLTPEVERLWWGWLQAGYNGNDLRDVIRYIRRQISFGKRNEGALKLSNLIAPGELGFVGFDQDLGLARSGANRDTRRKLEAAPDGSGAQVSTVRPHPGPLPQEREGTARKPEPSAFAKVLGDQLKKLREAAE